MKQGLKNDFLLCLGSLLSFFTLYLITRVDMTQDNLTYVANVLDYHFAYIVWSLLSGCFFFIAIRELYSRLALKQPSYLFFQIVVFCMLVGSSLLPYNMEINPIVSSLHVDLVSLAVIFYCLFLVIYLFKWATSHFIHARNAFYMLGFLLTIGILIFIYYGKITGLMELILMIGIILFTLYLLYFDK